MTARETMLHFIPYLKDLAGNTGEDKVEAAIKAYAQEKCLEQRVICADKALLEVTILNTVTGQGANFKNHLPYSNQVAETTEEIVCADKDSILNAPEPKFD